LLDLAQKIKKWRGDLDNTFGGLLSSSSVPDSTKQDMIVGVVLDGFSPAHGTWGKYIYSYAHSHGKDIDSFINQISSGGSSISAGDYSYTITNISPLPYSSMGPDFKLQAGLIILLQNFGMLDTNVLTSNQVPVFTQMAANLAKALSSSDPKKAKVALSEQMKVFSSEKKSKADAVVQRYFSRNADSKDLSQLASFFQNGINKLVKIAVPEFVSLKIKKGGSIVTSILAPVDRNKIETSGGWIDYINTFGDTDNIARAQVECLTVGSQSSVPVDTNATIKIAGTTETIPSTKNYTCADLPPVILPEARRMLRIYAQSAPATQIAIKEAVSQQESIYITEALMGALNEVKALIFGRNTKDTIPIKGGTTTHATDTNSSTTINADDLNNVNNNTVNSSKIVLESINNALKGLKKQLTFKLEKLHSIGPYGSFNKYLNTLDQRNKQNALRNIGQ